MCRYNLFALLSIFVLVNLSQAQSYYFRHYQVEQGLSNNTVFSCEQDRRGFMWMGTKDGLNRFNGYSFKVFRNDPEDSHSIGDNFIRSLFISKDDTLYAGTRNGIYRYNVALENFVRLFHTDEEVRDIKKDLTGEIWFVAGQTLYRCNEKSLSVRSYDKSRYFAATSVCIDINGTVWVSTTTGLLARYDRAGDSFTSYDVFGKSVAPSGRWIEKIFATRGSQLLVGTSNYGIKSFDVSSGSWKDILVYNPDGTGIFARNFVQTSDQEIWIATESGIFIYNSLTGKAINLKKQFGNPYAISDNAVYSLCRDNEGGIWAGTYFGGINYYPRQYVSFEKYLPGYSKTSLSGFAVREICEDNNGQLWIGTEDAGLNRLDKHTGNIRQFMPTGGAGSISYPNIHGLLVKNDQLWIGTFEHGLDIMNIRTGKVIRHYPAKPDELRSNFIVVVYHARDGGIYIGTRRGLYLFNEVKHSFNPVPGIPGDSFIHAITEDSEGVIWVGTLGQGLFYINKKTGASGHFNYQPQSKRGLNNNSVTTVFESQKKQLWIGTEGGGLHLFVPADSSFVYYTSKHGFPSNTIFRVLEDNLARLWITTANGLVCFNPETLALNVYTTANGLLSNQFNYNSGYKDTTGNMYFGSAKGLISFNPGSFTESTYRPPVFITGLYTGDREMLPGREGSPLETAISLTKEVVLKPGETSFSIDFAALTFTAPETTEYQYIMEGLDHEWTYLKTNRKVYFTNLSPGTYTFKVKAVNGKLDGEGQPAQLLIRIPPPLWASPIAYGLYAAIALALVIFVIRSYHNRMKEKTRRRIEHMEHEKEREIYQAKIDFFINVAHEIKTPLTLVRAPMEQIAKKTRDNADLAYDIRIMQRNTDRLLELTNQLLDFRKAETNGFQLNFAKVNINELLIETCSGFKALADQKAIRFSVGTPDKPVFAHVDIDSLQKILNNLLSNAFTYCRSIVEITLYATDIEPAHFMVEVKNDGDLIPQALKQKIFEPFYRINTQSNKSGSGIGLALSRSLAALHKGSIVVSEDGEGMNVFVLKLPFDQANETGDEKIIL